MRGARGTAGPPMAKSRSRSSVLLLLCLVSLGGLSASLRGMENNAERFGALCLPFGLFVAGAWYAYKDGARGARIGAVVLGLMIFGGFGFGLVRGLRQAKGHAELERELASLRTEIARDPSPDESGVEAARRDAKLVQAAVARLSDSDSPNAAAIGRILQRTADLRAPIEERLIAAVDAIASASFLDLPTLLEAGDFARQREVALEYEHAARAAFDFYQRLPKVLDSELAGSGLSPDDQAGMRSGMERTRPLMIVACQGHGRLASEYARLIDFLSERRLDAEVDEYGTVTFASSEHAANYDACWERIADAEQKLDAAVVALQAALTR